METTSVSTILIIFLAAAAVIGIIAILLYRNRVNSVLKGERSGAHTVLPAPSDTVNGLFKIITVVLLVWVCISMGKLSSIQQELDTLKNMTQSNSFNVSNEVSQIKDDLLKMNSKVFSYSSSVGSVDTSDNTCLVKHTVRLKTFSDDTEVIFVAGDGSETKMSKTGEGSFEAELKTDLFKQNYNKQGITIKENGANYYEELQDDSFYGMAEEYWQMFIPSLDGEFGIGAEYRVDNIHVDNIVMFSYFKADYNIASAKVIVEKNGQEIDSVDALDSFKETSGEFSIPVNKDYPITEKDNVKATLVLITEEGYTLEQLLFEKTESKYVTYGNKFTIKDLNGQLVLSR